MSEESHDAEKQSTWMRRSHVQAFYTGHSLSAGVPEAVERIARSLGDHFTFQEQVLDYSLLRQRTKGETDGTQWTGYGAGNNRNGSGLNVAAELRNPKHLSVDQKYDVLVATERHDLPAVAGKERTAFYLAELTKHLLAGNSNAEVFLYHTWLGVDADAPLPWVEYERSVLRMWECIASRTNLDLEARGAIPRVRVLPGGAALAELIAELWAGNVPGVARDTAASRVRLAFADTVHMSEVGRYFLALVHYAVLFGRSPEGAASPASLKNVTSRYMQALAWRYVTSYGRNANNRAKRDMTVCRDLVMGEICPAFASLRTTSRIPLLTALKQALQTYRCRKGLGNAFSEPSESRKPH